MFTIEKILDADKDVSDQFIFEGQGILNDSVYLDLEHYIFRKPVCIGIFGAACLKDDVIICTQYMLENKKDLRGLVRTCFEYLEERKDEGYRYLVTFAGANDIMVLRAMAEKYSIDPKVISEFIHIDIQKEFRKKHGVTTGLKTIEEIMGIERSGKSPSGMSIARTFSRIMKDPGYSQRMDKDKIRRLTDYNREDVVNLYSILRKFNGPFDEMAHELRVKRDSEAEKRKELKEQKEQIDQKENIDEIKEAPFME